MDAVTYSTFRQNLKSYMKQVNEDVEPMIVTARDVEETIVVMSKRDYDSMQETMRILSNNYLMDKLQRADQQFHQGKFKEHGLLGEVDD